MLIMLPVYMILGLTVVRNNQLECSFLMMPFLPPQYFCVPVLAVVLCAGLRIPGLSLINFSISFVVLLIHFMLRQSCWKNYVVITSDNSRNTVSQQTSCSSGLSNPSVPSVMNPVASV